MEKRIKNLLMKSFALIFIVAGLVKLTTSEEVVYEPDYAGKKTSAYSFVKAKKMDSTICFLIDMKAHMGNKRFAIWDFKGDTILREMIVTHGAAGVKGLPFSTAEKPVFSNVPGSNASSLGKYRVGARSYSNWGINVHYKLHGLEPTNNNAFRRIVVLHSYFDVSKEEVYPDSPPYSLGCPMVSDEDMTYLDSLLKKKKDVMMWFYN